MEELHAKFSYDPRTGNLYTRRGRVGSVCKINGILTVSMGYKKQLLRAHRVAFALMEGRWPDCVSHINGDLTDNRWCNLVEGSMRDFQRCSSDIQKSLATPLNTSGASYRISFTAVGKRYSLSFTSSADLLDFRRYLDEGFQREGEAFQPLIPSKAERIKPHLRDRHE